MCAFTFPLSVKVSHMCSMCARSLIFCSRNKYVFIGIGIGEGAHKLITPVKVNDNWYEILIFLPTHIVSVYIRDTRLYFGELNNVLKIYGDTVAPLIPVYFFSWKYLSGNLRKYWSRVGVLDKKKIRSEKFFKLICFGFPGTEVSTTCL